MPKINVDPDEFADIVMAYLFDKYLNFDEVSAENENFNYGMKKARGKMFPISRGMYLDMDANLRLKYKLIKEAFRGDTATHSIFIVPRGRKKKKEKPGIVAKVLKKVWKTLVASNEFSREKIELLKEQVEYLEEMGDQEDEI